jgi:osmotically-inducible protein OsmY
MRIISLIFLVTIPGCLLLFIFLLSGCSSQNQNIVIEKIREQAALIGDYELEVEARGSSLTLTGRVADENARNTIEQIARSIDGVGRVENRLSIDPSFRPAAHSHTSRDHYDRLNVLGENDISRSILARVRADHLINGYKLEIQTDSLRTGGNSVILRGEARNLQDIERITSIAWQEPGVSTVRNLMQIKASRSDQEIYTDALNVMRRQSELNMANINLTVREGSLKVRGDAPTFRAVDALLADLQMIDGVMQVSSQMTVQGRPYEALWTISNFRQ